MKNPWLHEALFALAAIALLAGCAKPAVAPAPREHTSAGRALGQTVGTERPGIGTSWGEQRVSWVEPTAFARASGNRPAARASFFYNDRDGINAMLDYLGGEPAKVSGLRPAGDVRFGLRDGDGSWLETWELDRKLFAMGERGHRYEVVLKNDSARPVEVLVSVDGLDALDGERAKLDKRGYVLEGGEEMAVEGFRMTDGTVAAFRFGTMGDTYAQRRHQNTKDCGVVGIAVFREGKAGSGRDEEPRPRRRARGEGPPSSREYAKPPEA